VTHGECLAALRARVDDPGAVPVAPEAREHLAQCWDCWRVAEALGRSVLGQPAQESERMESLFGCAGVRERLFLLTDTSADVLPDVARHLAWCDGCRGRLAELRRVAAMETHEELEPLFAPAARPRWLDTVTRLGAAVRELTETTVVRLERGLLALAAVPSGAVTTLRPAVAMRQDAVSSARSELSLGLADSGLRAVLGFDRSGPARVALGVRLEGAAGEGCAVSLRAAVSAEHPEGELLARCAVRGDESLDMGDVPAGEYRLEIFHPASALRFRVPLAILDEGR
jgi:hypothetical protein